MTFDRDYCYIRNLRITHAVARKDWCCGECGSSLVTRWYEQEPNWRTVCSQDEAHDPQGFIHQSSWAYREAQQQMDTLVAQDVYAHLPPEVRAMIAG